MNHSWAINIPLISINQWIGLGKIYRKTPYLMVKNMVSCKFSLNPIHWISIPWLFGGSFSRLRASIAGATFATDLTGALPPRAEAAKAAAEKAETAGRNGEHWRNPWLSLAKWMDIHGNWWEIHRKSLEIHGKSWEIAGNLWKMMEHEVLH